MFSCGYDRTTLADISGVRVRLFSLIFFFNDTATTEIYTLSLHDALPIFELPHAEADLGSWTSLVGGSVRDLSPDRKSTRLNSSHSQISYAVFCLKKKKKPTLRSSRRHPA